MNQWYCFRTPPLREIRTVHTLRQHGFDVIILMRPERRRAHRKHNIKTVFKREPYPALRPYIFVDMSSPDAWARKDVAPVNIHPVAINGHVPRPLSKEGVKYIMRSNKDQFHDTDWEKFDELPTAEDDFEPVNYSDGDKVKITQGPFRGYEVEVANVSGREARVLLPLFGGSVDTVKIPAGHAERVA